MFNKYYTDTNGITWIFTTYVDDDGNTYARIGNDSNSAGNGATSSSNLSGDIVIPGTVTDNSGTYTVKKIGQKAFRDRDITSVTIPNSVVFIGNEAFKSCSNLTGIVFESGSQLLTIDDNAFRDCSNLTSVTIPNSVETIGQYSFSGCSNLTSVTIPDLVETIGQNSFAGCFRLTSLTIGNSVESIGQSAFHGCSELTSVTIPDSVETIGQSAFRSCVKLESVIIPDSVDTIGNNAFRGCSELTSVTIGNSVETISNLCFFQCPSLTSVTIGNSVKTIGQSAFQGCSFTSVTIPNTVETIVANAFRDCSQLGTITIPVSVTSIGNNAFNNSGLSTVFIADQQVISGTTFSSPDMNVSFYGISVTTQIPIQPPAAPICFPKGTPVATDQGIIAIEQLNSDKHTIRGKEIVAITQSQPLQKHIVCFEKDSLSKNVPSQETLCSMEHKVFYKGEMMKARNIVDVCENVTFNPYNGETLYNVLLKKHDKMMINNLICETLHPKNIMAKISTMKDIQKKNKAIQELTKIIKDNNVPEYQKLYASL